MPGPEEAASFRELVYREAALCRRDFPWRRTTDPYAIMVSEFMLQQTRTERVAPRFEAWMAAFPTLESLAGAGRDEVLAAWSGLGYNRRALALHAAAAAIRDAMGGRFPRDRETLQSLPGIGPYTAGAILAFSFDIPAIFLETNIRTVLIKHFYPGRTGVGDRALGETAERVLDASSPRRWYNSLMDYGAEIKRGEENYGARGSAYKRQKPFEGSFRKLRGKFLKRLIELRAVDIGGIAADLAYPEAEVARCAELLVREGFAEYRDGKVILASGPGPSPSIPAEHP